MIQVTFLGTGAATPSVARGVSSLAIQRGGEVLLFDCGEGTQRQMMRYGSGFTIEDVFISHYHADHILGIPGLLRTMGLMARTAPIRLWGPRGAERTLGELVTLGMERMKFPVEIHELNPGDILDRGDYVIEIAAADHKGACLAYGLIEKERLGRFDPDRARALGIPEGSMWGKIHRGERVTTPEGREVDPAELVGPPRTGRRVVYSGDTAPCNSVMALAAGADLLIHEATFGDDEKSRAIETRHSTAREAAELARDAGVRQLALTHISARYSREAPELLAEAQRIFPATQIAKDGLVVEVPYADGGDTG